MTEPVLSIEDLHLSFPIFRGEVHALNHVSLEIAGKLSAWWANPARVNP
jgi:ABC-type glutathione transport system ATPase component